MDKKMVNRVKKAHINPHEQPSMDLYGVSFEPWSFGCEVCCHCSASACGHHCDSWRRWRDEIYKQLPPATLCRCPQTYPLCRIHVLRSEGDEANLFSQARVSWEQQTDCLRNCPAYNWFSCWDKKLTNHKVLLETLVVVQLVSKFSFLMKLKVHFRVYKSAVLDAILSHVTPVQTLVLYLF
jgi:hypothetical protein